MTWEKKADRIFLIHHCGGPPPKLQGFFKKDIRLFALDNPGTLFADMHMPSLVLALAKMKGQNPLLEIRDRNSGSLESIGWERPQFDRQANLYRAQSAIELVQWYRL